MSRKRRAKPEAATDARELRRLPAARTGIERPFA
jgi:hypothetical protein